MFSQSDSSSSSSSKAIYTAVPLLPQSAAAAEESAREPLLSNEEASKSPSSSYYGSVHFVGGGVMGTICYYAVHSAVLPIIPHMTNAVIDSAFAALVWSAITTLVAYATWFAFFLASKPCYDQDQKQQENDDDDDEENAFWEDMEFYYALGVFLGFSAACVVFLAMAGVPMIFLLAVMLSAFVWTKIMTWMGKREPSKRGSKTVLPTVVV